MIITQTPLRVSLAGGGTDLAAYYQIEDGGSLSFAIDKYVFVIVSERFDNRIYVNYTKKEIVDSVDEIQHDLVREAMRRARVKDGVEITMLADIPSEGSGLGSSSSLTVGLLNALYIFRGRQMPAAHLAREACEIEIEVCGKPIGKQDQYIAAFGGIHEFTYRGDGSVTPRGVQTTPAERRRLGSELLLFFTDITRKADTILGEQTRRTADNVEHLRKIRDGVPRVREAIEKRPVRDHRAGTARELGAEEEAGRRHLECADRRDVHPGPGGGRGRRQDRRRRRRRLPAALRAAGAPGRRPRRPRRLSRVSLAHRRRRQQGDLQPAPVFRPLIGRTRRN